VEQYQRSRISQVEQEQESRRQVEQRRAQQVLWTVGIVVALVVLIRIGYALQWTGFGQSQDVQEVRPAKTLWDWLKLLIVPVVLAIGGYLFTRSENRATQAAAGRQAQEEALQAYLDNMSGLLIPTQDQPSLYDENPPDSLKTVARARTITVLPRLAGDGKGRVVQFLHESNLILRVVRDQQTEVVHEKVVDLSGANLRDANLSGLNLRGVALDGVNLERADLSYASLRDADLGRSLLFGAKLSSANLSGASLSRANLMDAKLSFADLRDANLSRAQLSRAYLGYAQLLGADLSGADLWSADLRDANLSRAQLSGAELLGTNLRDADLSGADLFETVGWSEEQPDQAKALDGATMPDGRVLKGNKSPHGPTFEEWRKSSSP
jgi:uncharacterized protein YjbI with pentapeptide repeats